MAPVADRITCIEMARTIARDDLFRTALADLIGFATDASAPDASLDAYLDHLAQGFAAMGFTTERMTEDGHPFLLASRVEDPGLLTVLGYGHGDTVPGMAGRWRADRDPWALTEADGLWYGRGIADNKGQHLINMTAMEAVIAARGSLGFNAHVLIEMGEEIGSPGLNAVAMRLKDRLAADLLIASDGPRVADDRPTMFLGARGATTLKLSLKRRDGGRHSGNFGGALANPALELAHALASIASRHGAVQVPGWSPDTVPEASRTALAGLTPAGGEVDADWGTPGLTPAERIHAWNSAEILAFTAGDPAAPVNAIPPEATAWVQLRHVMGIDQSAIAANLRRHLDAQGFADITVEETGAAFTASQTPADHPAARFAARSLAATAGAPPVVLPSLGGSLPNEVFTDTLGIPAIWVPHSYPGCSQHAPNEHLPASIFPDAVGLMAGLYWDLGAAARADVIG
jgi:acetylornithine deacetylase/succinyl-diaminopimelate desuccinylase-like protein